jgi:hypothetical protein
MIFGIGKMKAGKGGAAQAAMLSAMLGCLTLAVVNLGTEMSDGFKTFVHQIGKLWMPGAEGIGTYSGKETLMLSVWILSWLILGKILRNREWNMNVVWILFLLGIGVATTLLWPPVFGFMGAH